jgi:precorrin isomerase
MEMVTLLACLNLTDMKQIVTLIGNGTITSLEQVNTAITSRKLKCAPIAGVPVGVKKVEEYQLGQKHVKIWRVTFDIGKEKINVYWPKITQYY